MKKSLSHVLVILLMISIALLVSCNLNEDKDVLESPEDNFSIINGYMNVEFCAGIWDDDSKEGKPLFNWQISNDRDNSQAHYLKPGTYNFWLRFPSPMDFYIGCFAGSNNEVIEFKIRPDYKYELILDDVLFEPLDFIWKFKEIAPTVKPDIVKGIF